MTEVTIQRRVAADAAGMEAQLQADDLLYETRTKLPGIVGAKARLALAIAGATMRWKLGEMERGTPYTPVYQAMVTIFGEQLGDLCRGAPSDTSNEEKSKAIGDDIAGVIYVTLDNPRMVQVETTNAGSA